MAQHIGFGIIYSSASGNRVWIANNSTVQPAVPFWCRSVLIQVLKNGTHTNTGNVYVFERTGKRVATLPVPTTNTVPSFTASIGTESNGLLNAADYSIDVDTTGDGADASCLQF